MDADMSRKLAVLIDAENVSYRYAKLILDEASAIGTVICKRIYADWSLPSNSSWKKTVLDYSIQPVQQFSSASGKNSSDSVLIIDAMDLLHTGKLQGFLHCFFRQRLFPACVKTERIGNIRYWHGGAKNAGVI